jgi:protein TonB
MARPLNDSPYLYGIHDPGGEQVMAEKGIYGDLYIRFTIMKNGRLGAVELVRTSGYRALDDAAIKALWDAEPYWPLPNEWGREGFTITGHFIYTLHGVYIK